MMASSLSTLSLLLVLVVCSVHAARPDRGFFTRVASAASVDDATATAAAASATATHTVRFYLRQRNVDVLERRLAEIADPAHADYGRWLSTAEIDALAAPPAVAARRVEAWLRERMRTVAATPHVERTSAASIDVTATLDAWHAAFGQRLELYRREPAPMTRGTVRLFRRFECDDDVRSRMPFDVRRWVDVITGLSDFPPPAPVKAADIQRHRRRLARRDATATATATDDNAAELPVFARARTGAPTATPPSINLTNVGSRGGAHVEVSFTVVCPNGNAATGYPICGNTATGAGATVESLAFAVAARFGHANVDQRWTQSVGAAPDASSWCQLPSTSGAPLRCAAMLAYEQQDYYVPLTVQGVAVHRESTFDVAGEWPYAAVVTPPIQPTYLDAYYGVPLRSAPPSANASSLWQANQSVAEFEQQYYSDADLRAFFAAFDYPTSMADLVTIVGPNHLPAGGEANLDIQWIMAVAPHVPTVFWSVLQKNNIDGLDDVLKWATQVYTAADAPLVHSLSYGMQESHVEPEFGPGYLERTNVELMKLALRGTTIVFATGDSGAGNVYIYPIGNGNDGCTKLSPTWPAGTSPYVTGVGSTIITPYSRSACWRERNGIDCSANALGEVVNSIDEGVFWTTAGGFSNLTPRPAWQNAAVEHYLSASGARMPPPSWFNSTGRAYPDVVVTGHNLEVMLDNSLVAVDGTSASAPIFAGMVTLINERRIAAGRPPLGWINPALYTIAARTPDAFTDIVYGNNRCATVESHPVCCDYGYEAVEGFDAASGLGSPHFELFAAEMAKL